MAQEHSDFVSEYLHDAWRRSILFLDVLRRRGNIYQQQKAKQVPNVLHFGAELVLDGRTLPRPVNYGLVRIIPPEGVETDDSKRPFVVVDPRAGHGPGIGGMKKDSEIGAALHAGHPCYFVGFTPEPLPGQTVEDVWTAEAAFIEEVARRHPKALGKPAVIANCQAGWQTAIMAATRPELAGPILLAGSPLSYWAGVRGKNPLRYLGGLLGGTWATALAGDMGAGKFDGASLVQNFEALNPANTLWDKPYNVYANVDTEVERFLDFETWWGSPVLLNAEEMQWIADSLFVGNKLAAGKLRTRDGLQIDLRNIQSPIVVFASWGDDITPPQQALGWITDLYSDDADIVTQGQTIVYALHETTGHLGIFVSGKVATKEHDEFVNAMDMLDMLPPGLYEATFEEVDEDTENRDLVEGRYLFRLEPRTLDDIRALGGNSLEDETRFAAAQRISDINLRLYQTFVAPFVRAAVTPEIAATLRELHPNRLRFAMFSDENPFMQVVAGAAEQARAELATASPDNPLAQVEHAMASWIGTSLAKAGEERDRLAERLFLATYGSPLLQALVGLDPAEVASKKTIERDLAREEIGRRKLAELDTRFEQGGVCEAVLRAIAYVRAGEKGFDERSFAMMQEIYAERPPEERIAPAEIKAIMRDQRALVLRNPKRALLTLPTLLNDSEAAREAALDIVRRIVTCGDPLSAEGQRRLARVERAFGRPPPASKSTTSKEALPQ
ncbi:MAG TPA: DUF3141 domain-containing protein [Croceibacterium sp.]|nr:DUF3141 domain-containing protein [Croceibacterium sp.]